MAEMKRNRNFIYHCGKFAKAREKHRVLQVYDEAIATLAKNLTAAGKI